MKKDTNLARFLADWKDLKPALLYAGFPTVAAYEIETGYQDMGEDISKDRFSVVPRIMDDLFRQGTLADFLTQIIRRAGRPKFQDEFLEHLQPLGLDWDRTTNKIRATGEVAEAKKETMLGEAKTQNAKVGEGGAPSNTEPTWDLFICHASEDKKEVAEPLAKMLIARDLKVWYDKFTLKVGDSLRQKIDYGLAHSRYGVVILSPSFFKKDWPQRELDGLAAREDSEGLKVILPVWHRVDRDYVVKYSPTLAGRFASKTSDGLNVVVKQLLEVIKEPSLSNGLPETHEYAAKTMARRDIENEQGAEPVDRLYELATLRFYIRTTTDWIEIGLVDSIHVTLNNHNLTEGTVKPVEEPNGCHLRIDHPPSAFFVTVTFEVYSGPLLVFLRKGDLGELKVEVRDKSSRFLQSCEYGATSQKYNYKEFGFDFSNWD
jgi:hypothetical protein